MQKIKMTTHELVKSVAELTGNMQKDVKEVIACIEKVIKAQVAQANEDTSVEVKLFNGLTIVSEYSAPRIARNPSTGETFTTEGKNRVKAKIGAALKTAANE